MLLHSFTQISAQRCKSAILWRQLYASPLEDFLCKQKHLPRKLDGSTRIKQYQSHFRLAEESNKCVCLINLECRLQKLVAKQIICFVFLLKFFHSLIEFNVLGIFPAVTVTRKQNYVTVCILFKKNFWAVTQVISSRVVS